MAKTYAQLMTQIETLRKEAEAIKKKEIEGVVKRIRQAIEFYQITADELFGGPRKVVTLANARPSTKYKTDIRYRDANGNVWSGRGRKPQWLQDHLYHGAKLEEFEVRNRKAA